MILDEVHERSLLCDFCLTLLRDSISAAGAAAPRLVLMSATLQAAILEYLGGALVVKVPGRLFDVQDLHLEDALEATGYSLSGRPSTGARFAAAAAQPGRRRRCYNRCAAGTMRKLTMGCSTPSCTPRPQRWR